MPCYKDQKIDNSNLKPTTEEIHHFASQPLPVFVSSITLTKVGMLHGPFFTAYKAKLMPTTTRHMIAPFTLFYHRCAPGTVLHLVVLFGFPRIKGSVRSAGIKFLGIGTA